MAVRLPGIVAEHKRPARVGYRKNYWGRDPTLRQHIEKYLSRIESPAAGVLRGLPSGWPLEEGSPDWMAFTYFMAVHMWRAPQTQEHLVEMQQRIIEARRQQHAHELAPEQLERFYEQVTRPEWRAQVMLDDLNKVASLLGSMHWTLVRFDDRLLATSDQPVTVVPMLDGSDSKIVHPVPRAGLLDCEEIRFALAPDLALIMSWLNEPEPTEPAAGNDLLAAQLNRAVITQADREWFYHPQRRPTTLYGRDLSAQGCLPLARLLHPGYGVEAARESQRRRDLADSLDVLIEKSITNEVRISGVARAA